MRPRRVRRTARRASLVVAAAVGLGLLAQGAASAQEEEPGNNAGKVVICHATGSHDNPYVQQEPSKNAIWNKAEPNGHGNHEGPIYSPELAEWGDIIPPFEYEVERGGETIDEDYPGMNWTAEGQAIWNNDCEIPEPVGPDEPEDVCPNLEDVQTEVPEGFEIVDGECVVIVVEPTDLCPNLEGVQTEVPEGFEIVDGECVVVTEVEPIVLEPDVEREVIVREVVTQPTIVAGVGGDDTEVLGVVQTAGPAASAGQLAVTGPATVPLLVLFGLLNLLFGARLRRYSVGSPTTS